MSFHNTKLDLDKNNPHCMYNTQGNVVCDVPKQTHFSNFENCVNGLNGVCDAPNTFQCNDKTKCGNKNDILFARFKDESTTWR
jgi:hypothetical protein